MKLLGLVGHPLTHSYSAEYFRKKFETQGLNNYEYKLYDLNEISKIREWANDHPTLLGLNVTIPFKNDIIPFLDEMDEKARKIGAVNTIKITNHIWKGFNTDYAGFKESFLNFLKEKKLQSSAMKALILGNGGSAKAVKEALKDLNVEFLTVSRSKSDESVTYDQLRKDPSLTDYPVIINTTPLGMHPDTKSHPDINYNQLTNQHLLFDLIYNPSKTRFLELGEKRGASIKNGLEMLYIQAEHSWKIWTSSF